MKSRNAALDGLRGLAIIFVVFNHIPLGTWYTTLPKQIHFFLDVLLSNGSISVSIFFILTGFLMGKLYPAPASTMTFLSRRYLRLYPPYLVMVVSITIIHLIGTIPPIIVLSIVLGCALIGRLLWIWLHTLNSKWHFSSRVLPTWLLVQASVAIGYVFFLLRTPTPFLLNLWPSALQGITTGLVNATMTLPFGQYILPLDGVYWTLAAEMLFYFWYPLLLLPLLRWTETCTFRIWKIVLFLSLFPFFLGLTIVSNRILGFETINFPYTIFFVAGAIIGLYTDYFLGIMSRLRNIILHPLGIIGLMVIIFGQVSFYAWIPKESQAFLHMVWVFPVGILLLLALIDESVVAKGLSTPILRFFGKYSYSLYLTHSLIIGLVQQFIKPTTFITGLVFTMLAFAGSIGTSFCLYHLIEILYFKYKKTEKSSEVSKTLPKSLPVFIRLNAQKSMWGLVVLTGVLAYLAFRPPLALFTLVKRHGTSSIFPTDRQTTVGTQPITHTFIASYNNLGLIEFHIRNQVNPVTTDNTDIPVQLLVALKNSGGETLATSEIDAHQIIDNRHQQFGFPILPRSNGKQFTLELKLSQTSPAFEILYMYDESDFVTVYFANKSDLLRHPQEGVTWFTTKINEPFGSPVFWYTIVLFAPLVFFMSMTFLPKRKKLSSLK